MSENQKKYHHASHSKYLLLAHLVFAVKYRKKLLREKVAEDMKAILLDIAENSDFSIDVLETDLDHYKNSQNRQRTLRITLYYCMETKTCKRCEQIKTTDEFYHSGNSFRNMCKECDKKNSANYKKNNVDAIKEYSKNYYAENKDKRRQNAQNWYYANHEDCKKRYRLAKQTPQRRALRNAAKRERYANDPDFRLKELMKARIYRALKKLKKSASTEELVGCSFAELKVYLASKFVEGMIWENYGHKWHVDHIIPCASFDFNDIEQQKRCFHYTNLQPLWKEDNMTKSDKVL
jgi:REP element-mobilizing transposase RayT